MLSSMLTVNLRSLDASVYVCTCASIRRIVYAGSMGAILRQYVLVSRPRIHCQCHSFSLNRQLSHPRVLTNHFRAITCSHTRSRRWLLHFRHTSPHHSGRRALQAIRPRFPRVTLNCNTHTNAIIIHFFLSFFLCLPLSHSSHRRAPMQCRSHSPL